jgi:uncharacterized membrane protein
MTNPNETFKASWSRNDWLLLGTNVILFAVLFFLFDKRLPEHVASHFNLQGEQDRSMAKGGFWLLYAGLGIALPAFLSFARYLDPRKANYARFERFYTLTRWAISLFLHGIMLCMILVSLDYRISIPNVVIGGLGLLWMVIGNGMSQVRSNFFIGIRTPWALADERNWQLTHRFGARMWFLAGAVMFISAWFVSPVGGFIVVITGALVSSLVPLAYSFILFKRNSRA